MKASKSTQQTNESAAHEANDFEKVWDNCLRIIKDNVSSQSFKTWFEPIKPIKLQNKILTIQVPSQFFYEWLEEHYINLLRKTLKNELGAEGRLEYSIIMENNANTSKPYTVKIPTNSKKSLSNPLSSVLTIRLDSPDIEARLKLLMTFHKSISNRTKKNQTK